MTSLLIRCFSLVLLCYRSVCFGNSPQSDSLFCQFKRDIQFELQENNGKMVWDDETVRSYCTLMIYSSTQDLLKYTNDSIPAIRAVVFSGLAQKGADINTLCTIANRHFYDSASYLQRTTDVDGVWNVSSFMQFVVDLASAGTLRLADFKDRLDRTHAKRIVFIPSTYHGTVSKDSLLKADWLLSSDSGLTIKSLSLTGTNWSTLKSTNAITQEVRNFIARLSPGDKLFIENITIELPDKTLRFVNPIAVKLR